MDGLLIVHDIPGRIRLRVPPGATVEGLAEAVAARPGVTSATWSPRTRSLLVLYDAASTPGADVVDSVARHTGVDAPRNGAASRDATAPITAGAAFGGGVREAFGELDHRVHRVTRGVVGLRALVPLTLAVWAVGEIVRGRTSPLPWSTALWYAHGLFRDYDLPSVGD